MSFKIKTRLSQGATCKVYDVELANSTPVILKACRKESLGPAIFKFVNIRHDNIEHIAKIVLATHSPMAYIFSEKLDMTLFDWKLLPANKRMPLDSANIYGQCARGLEYIHKQMNIVHADVKNNNIMLHVASGRLKLIDFSNAFEMSRARVDGFEQTLLSMCHVDLLRDEFDVGFKLDMWALAMTLYWFEYDEHFIARMSRYWPPPRPADFEEFVRSSRAERRRFARLLEQELCLFQASEGKDDKFKELFFHCLRARP